MLVTAVDHKQKGIDRLVGKLRGKDKLEKLLSLFLNQTQEVEDSLIDFAGKKNIYTSEGDWLDLIGSVLGVTRNLLLDEPYRASLLLKIQTASSSGTHNEVIEAVKGYTNATSVRLTNFTLAAGTLYTNGSINGTPLLRDLVDKIKPVGTRIIIHTDLFNTAIMPLWELSDKLITNLEVEDGGAKETFDIENAIGAVDVLDIATSASDRQYYEKDLSRGVLSWETALGLVHMYHLLADEELFDNFELYTTAVTDTTPLCWEVE